MLNGRAGKLRDTGGKNERREIYDCFKGWVSTSLGPLTQFFMNVNNGPINMWWQQLDEQGAGGQIRLFLRLYEVHNNWDLFLVRL